MALVNRQTAFDSLGHGSLDVVDRTHQDDLTKFAVPRSGTHRVAERALDRREDGLRQRSLAVASHIDPRVMRVIDGAELTVLNQWSHAFFSKFIA